jgi:hypothetical protein
LSLTPLSAIFQLYHGDQFVVEEAGILGENHVQATGKLYHLRLRTHAVLVIGLYELLGNPTSYVVRSE